MVLGPHRSGTSALSGLLSHLGGDLPKTLMPAGGDNVQGYFESQRVMAFNDKLLNALGSDWKSLTPLDPGSTIPQVFESLMTEAVQVLQEEFSAANFPLLKDPRICRFVGFWDQAFSRAGYEPLFVHTHRNPLETAQSLQKRDGIPIELGLLLWLRHVLDAEAATRGRVRVFTNYKALLEDWRVQITRMEQALGLNFPRNTGKVRQEIDDFLTGSLRHEQRAPEDVRKSAQVADIVRETFQILESWAGGSGASSDHDALDALRGRMNGALDQVTTLVRALDAKKDLSSELKAVAQKAQLLEKAKADLTTELERDRQENAERVTRIAELEQKIEAYQGETARLNAELDRECRAREEGGAEQAAKIADLERRKVLSEEENARLVVELERQRQVNSAMEAEKANKIAELERRAFLSHEESIRLTTELEHHRQTSAGVQVEHAARVAELEAALRQRSLEAEDELERHRQTSAGVQVEHAARVAELEAALRQRSLEAEDELERHRQTSAGVQVEHASRVAELEAALRQRSLEAEDELERHRQTSAGVQVEHAARVAEREGALRQRSLEAEEWFEANCRLASAQASLKDEIKKLEGEQSKELERCNEIIRSRDERIQLLERSVKERFNEIADITRILLNIQSAKESKKAALIRAEARIALLTERNEQLKRVSIKKFMARYSRNIRIYLGLYRG